MKRFLARWWPYGPLLVTAAGAVWYSTWPWITGLAASGLAAWAWEHERRWRNRLPPLPQHAPAGREAAARLSTGMAAGHPERLTGRLAGAQEQDLAAMQEQAWPHSDWLTRAWPERYPQQQDGGAS